MLLRCRAVLEYEPNSGIARDIFETDRRACLESENAHAQHDETGDFLQEAPNPYSTLRTMTAPIWSSALLCSSAFLAGVVNAIAGGGTLLTFPSLLALIGPVAANATSTMALLPGSLAAAVGYRDELAGCRRMLLLLLPPSLIGGIIGSILLIRLPEKVFAHLIPWFLILASTLLMAQRPLMRYLERTGKQTHRSPRSSGIFFFQLLVGIYGGYFGAGIGILMLSSLALRDSRHSSDECRKDILAATMNGVTAIILAYAGAVKWQYAILWLSPPSSVAMRERG